MKKICLKAKTEKDLGGEKYLIRVWDPKNECQGNNICGHGQMFVEMLIILQSS
jgi:hypothetical protein